jgi:hypothetical protein
VRNTGRLSACSATQTLSIVVGIAERYVKSPPATSFRPRSVAGKAWEAYRARPAPDAKTDGSRIGSTREFIQNERSSPVPSARVDLSSDALTACGTGGHWA